MRKYFSTAMCLFIVSTTTLGVAQAQTPATKADNHDHAGHSHAGHSHAGETVAFVLSNWKTMHFDDAGKAAQHAETIKKLGCEMKQEKHAGISMWSIVVRSGERWTCPVISWLNSGSVG